MDKKPQFIAVPACSQSAGVSAGRGACREIGHRQRIESKTSPAPNTPVESSNPGKLALVAASDAGRSGISVGHRGNRRGKPRRQANTPPGGAAASSRDFGSFGGAKSHQEKTLRPPPQTVSGSVSLPAHCIQAIRRLESLLLVISALPVLAAGRLPTAEAPIGRWLLKATAHGGAWKNGLHRRGRLSAQRTAPADVALEGGQAALLRWCLRRAERCPAIIIGHGQPRERGRYFQVMDDEQ